MNRLKFVRLSGNKVKPPSCFSRLSELQELDFRSNDYAGELPNGLYALPSLTSLELSGNEFVGSIDMLFPEVKSNGPIFPNLRTLNLANNNLSGEIPENALRRLRSLDNLILNGNPQLSGSLNEMCKGDDISQIDADCDKVSCKCCTMGKNCPSSLLPV
jgi:Leucine-rich repeat (LRR) protein